MVKVPVTKLVYSPFTYYFLIVSLYIKQLVFLMENFHFLGGLSLHLNHLTASHAANYDWPFGTLPFGLFGSNVDTRDYETYPRT